ncbi:RNA methyltransferase, TrmH family protein [Besnoitia besnoiti]|uniref:RNA methyltransferase, TrmH family protein n=1 Tax=Besnoitia besnoiti TaxID=94643 RepID=A0A2A9MIC2_BESBE|nr:RNA methyltransferase, TrmH family protein [Besnoitia besnoiti]PFH37735.1 RNA methyltransferase, TrmH family protein [Besnoitia besnoiti]
MADEECGWKEEDLPSVSCRVRRVTSADDPAVCMYRMKGVRDNYIFSQLKARMLARNAWYVPACSSTVVRRALCSPFYPVQSLLLTPVLFCEMAEKIEAALHRRSKLLKAYEALGCGKGAQKDLADPLDTQASACKKADATEQARGAEPAALQAEAVRAEDDEVEVLLVTEKLFSEILGMPVNHRQCCAALVDVRMPTFDGFLSHQASSRNGETSLEKANHADAAVHSLGPARAIQKPRCDDSSSLLCAPDSLFPLVVFDDVQSSDNIGTLMRTSFSLGMKSVLLSPVSYAAVNARSARVSMGSMFHLRLLKCDRTAPDAGVCPAGSGFAWSRHSALDASKSNPVPLSPMLVALRKLRRISPACVLIGTSPVGDPRILHRPSEWIRSRSRATHPSGKSWQSGEPQQTQVSSEDRAVSDQRAEAPHAAQRAESLANGGLSPNGHDTATGGATGAARRKTDEAEETCWAVVMGNEKNGCSREVLEECDGVAAIAQVKGDSLSVSTAAAVVLYALQQETLIKLREQVPFVPDEDLTPEED